MVEAAKARNRNSVAALINARADVNTALPDGSTALAWAAYHDDAGMVDLLLKAGAKVTADEYGETPLTLACANGNARIVEKLLQAGADANAARWNGETALMIAARFGSPQSVAMLIKHGAKPDSVETRKGQNALMWAAAEGNAEAVEILLKASANPNLASKAGFTPLVFAVFKGDAKSVSMLAAAGAKPDVRIPGGTNALLVAMSSGKLDVADVLISSGANLASKDPAGYTPLHMAVQSGDLDLVKKLIAKGADVNVKSNKGAAATGRGGAGGRGRVILVGEQTPLLLAARANRLEIMRALVAAGADPAPSAQDGATLLMAAAGSGRVEVVQYAYELSPDLKALTETKQTAVHAAVSAPLSNSSPAEICKVIQFLADKGADVDAADASGRTPLGAARGVAGLENAVELLTKLITASGGEPKAQPKR